MYFWRIPASFNLDHYSQLMEQKLSHLVLQIHQGGNDVISYFSLRGLWVRNNSLLLYVIWQYCESLLACNIDIILELKCFLHKCYTLSCLSTRSKNNRRVLCLLPLTNHINDYIIICSLYRVSQKTGLF